MYSTWKEFADAIAETAGDEYELSGSIAEVNACAEFEHKNGMSLSEVGDIILNELLWNRQLIASAESDGDYYVN